MAGQRRAADDGGRRGPAPDGDRADAGRRSAARAAACPTGSPCRLEESQEPEDVNDNAGSAVQLAAPGALTSRRPRGDRPPNEPRPQSIIWCPSRSVAKIRSRMSDRQDEKRGPRRVPLLPLRDIIVFPHMVVPLFVGREKSISALEEAMAKAATRRSSSPRSGRRRPTSRSPRTSSRSGRSARSSSCCACPTAP